MVVVSILMIVNCLCICCVDGWYCMMLKVWCMCWVFVYVVCGGVGVIIGLIDSID